MTTKLLEELLVEAGLAEEPAMPTPVVHRPTAELPIAGVALPAKSAGYVFIYDTRTRERSVTNRNMLVSQLRKVRNDGSKVFTTVKPAEEPVRGTITCLLHSDRPERDGYAAMGWAACPKHNLPSEFQLRQHMQHRHRVEWATIEDARLQAEKNEERAFQRSMIALGAHTVLESTRTATAAPLQAEPSQTESSGACEICGEVFTSTGRLGLFNRLRGHRTKSHPELQVKPDKTQA